MPAGMSIAELNVFEASYLVLWLIAVGWMLVRFLRRKNGWTLSALIIAALVPVLGTICALIIGIREVSAGRVQRPPNV